MKLGMVPSNIRHNNQINVIKILKKKPYTHKQLANKLKLSNTAIQNIVSSLQSKNLVTITNQLVNKTGRPSTLVSLNVENFYTIKVLFADPSSIEVYAYDFSKELLSYKISSYTQHDTDDANKTILNLINETVAIPALKNKTLCNIVLSVPGIVNNDNLVITTALNNNTKPYDPYSYLSKHFSCDIFINDDKISYAQGELTVNKNLSQSDVIVFFHMPAPSISLAIHKTIYRGANGFFGEIGFVSERLTTDNQIKKSANIDDATSLINVIKDISNELYPNETKTCTIGDVAELLYKKHPLVTEKISMHCNRLCSFILNLSILFDFDTLIFTGEFAPLKDYYFERIQQTLNEHAFAPIKLLLGNPFSESSNIGILDMAIENGLISILNKD